MRYMKKASEFFYKKSNIIVCVILTTLMVLYASLVMGSQSKCIPDGVSILGLRFSYDYESVIGLFNSLSSDALHCYNNLLKIWDNIFPFLYGSMYIFWLSLIYKKQQFRYAGLRFINLYPVIPMLADFIENYFERNLIGQFLMEKDVMELNVTIASVATQIKWSLSTINYIIILTGIILLIKRTVKR